LIKEAQVDAERRWELYRQLAELNYKLGSKDEA
jgi:pyruvate-ferredoxin/flavodoxin oxidoreductase